MVDSADHLTSSRAAEREPELDPVLGLAEVAAGQLLDPADPVAERMPVAVEVAGGPLPLPVALDERLERAEQLRAVLPLASEIGPSRLSA